MAQTAAADRYRHRAELYYDQGRYDQARTYYLKAYELVWRNDPVRAANLCVDISSLDHRDEQYRAATTRCWVGIAHLRKAAQPPDSLWFKLYSSLGTMYQNSYLRDSALYHYGQADALFARSPAIVRQIPDYVLYHYNNQGRWYADNGNYARAVVYFLQSRKVAFTQNRASERPFIDGNLAICYYFLGNHKEAFSYLKRANEEYKIKDSYKVGYLIEMGWFYNRKGSFDKALFHYNQALKIYNGLGTGRRSHSQKAELFRLFGEVFRQKKDFSESERYINAGIVVCLKNNETKGTKIARLYTEQGHWHADQKQFLLAAAAYQKAVGSLLIADPKNGAIAVDNVLNGKVLLDALTNKAAVLTQCYRVSADTTHLLTAAHSYLLAAQLKINLHLSYEAEETKLLFSEQQTDLFDQAIATVYEVYALRRSVFWREALFRLFEQSAAGSLHDALRLRELYPRNLPDSLVAQERALQATMSGLRAVRFQSAQNKAKWQRTRLSWYQLLAIFERAYPAYYRLKYQPLSLTSATLCKQLDPQSVYVAYHRTNNQLYLLVATQTGMEIIRQPIDSKRWPQAQQELRQSLYQNPGFGNYNGLSAATLAHRYLIEPLRPWLVNKNRLVLQRGWELQWLPFEVLESGQRANDYLAKHYAISYAYSASIWAAQTSAATVASVLPTLVVAPFIRPIKSLATEADSLGFLPASAAEARRIGGEMWFGAAATKARLTAANLQRSVIYLATHAQTNDADPAASYVMLYPKGDCRLRAEEIYRLPLQHTRLLVLSACEAGNGQTARGEGVLSLARAFAYAGCPSVATTLWQAQDECSAFLSVHLHHHLQDGLPIDEALHRARKDFFAAPLSKKYNHPHYWANLVLLGGTNPIFADSSFSIQKKMGWAGLLAVLLLGSAIIYKTSYNQL